MRSFLTVSACTAALLALSACSATDAPQTPQTPATPAPIALDRTQLLDDLRILAADDMEGREAGTEGSARARAYLIERFEEAGIAMIGDTYESPFTYQTRVDTGEVHNGINLIGRIEGTGDSDHTMVVSAHYDHVGMRDGEIWNGADDNASGVAAMLAVAADFAANPPEHDVIFAALDAEERGLQGAYHFVANPPVDREDITFNLNLDMVAMSEDRILWAVGTYHYPFLVPVVEAVAARSSVNLPMGYDEPTDVPGADWTLLTDSGAFHRAGIPFIYLGVDFHPHYHQPTDTYENMTLEFFQDASETIVDFAREADANLAMIAEAGAAE
ncbi:M20/M25/M40 family metallo-hydrolase [Maricaulis sp.]|uniref:M20/M25/M40 family metallo-hydrolase n=1 Tax=Maricaulis sp. TaxID=1486257 RepID=UPI002611349D|nr:M20/M25/M40 family metallo-hydrolase [Maricaulis sp.]